MYLEQRPLTWVWRFGSRSMIAWDPRFASGRHRAISVDADKGLADLINSHKYDKVAREQSEFSTALLFSYHTDALCHWGWWYCDHGLVYTFWECKCLPWIHNLHKEELKLEDKRMFSLSSSPFREGNLDSPGTSTGSGAGSPISGRANKKAHLSAIHPPPKSYRSIHSW